MNMTQQEFAERLHVSK
ncbi:MAG: hypothetical protein GX661_04905 [Acholeplasmataceae bacterium]|nr:hypothetical protein [Acholeplasmataceae bacterium]